MSKIYGFMQSNGFLSPNTVICDYCRRLEDENMKPLLDNLLTEYKGNTPYMCTICGSTRYNDINEIILVPDE